MRLVSLFHVHQNTYIEREIFNANHAGIKQMSIIMVRSPRRGGSLPVCSWNAAVAGLGYILATSGQHILSHSARRQKQSYI